MSDMIKAQRLGHLEDAKDAQQEYVAVMKKFVQFCIANKIGGSEVRTMNAQIKKGATQRITGAPAKVSKWLSLERQATEQAYTDQSQGE